MRSIFFPELKESDDERIRKGLLRHFKNETKPYWNEIAVKDIVAYLERQKEQKPTSGDSGKPNTHIEWSDNFEENIRNLLNDKLTWHSEDGSMSATVLIDDKTLKDIVSGIWFYVGKETLKYPNKELNVTEWSKEDAVSYCYDNGINISPRQANGIARHFYELGRFSQTK